MAESNVMKVEVIARETIKPSSPTPHHLRSFKLSLTDQTVPPMHLQLVYFYATSIEGGSERGENGVDAERSQRLKKSLSETLTRFYPVVGRIRDHLSIDCNDEGVDFLEARVNCPISEVLERPRNEMMKHFVPTQPTMELLVKAPLLLVQANFFPCGGMALGICISHKIADAASYCEFVKAWASMALGSPSAVLPDFTSAFARFPPIDQFSDPKLTMLTSFLKQPRNVATSRFVFEASKIAELKAKAASMSIQCPTRFEAVTALLWKCIILASRSRSGSPQPSVLIAGINMRPRLVPPFPHHSFGNVLGQLRVVVEEQEREIDLSNLLCRIRKGIEESSSSSSNSNSNGSSKEVGNRQIKMDDMVLYALSSWCRFPLYEADFGWGKPTWVSPGFCIAPNCIALLDTKEGGGIEVYISLIEEDMALLQCDRELLAFANLNPSRAGPSSVQALGPLKSPKFRPALDPSAL
ncbi:stemmadenine O-acetyltransferase-like [Actinidia eriantha]|uniref:stemmadenine O-acetyltransferase-like n=1 Tax=Actinidia eriantha TaxID=165200 RepID=UPI002590D30F|nr:stemmadenine O-acetyltransferase-like [Actinidia eriantha]